MNESENIRFTQFLREKAAEAKRDLGYHAKEFIKMLDTDGGYATVSRLIADKNPSSGFVKLFEHGRLDLSVEALVLESEWRRFFEESVLRRAEARLKGSRYILRHLEASSRTDRLPAEILNKATPEYIWCAVQQFLAGDVVHSFGPSTDYDLIADHGRRLPPKAVFGVALSMALVETKIEPKHFTAGDTSVCFRLLRAAGYQVVPKGEAETGRDRDVDTTEGWAEGKPRLVAHVRRERGHGIAQAKKAQHRRLHGRLFCERCKLDPVEHFGTKKARLASRFITLRLTSAR